MTTLDTSTPSIARSNQRTGYGIIRQFTPNWFAVTMGTGILSVALGQFPGQAPAFAVGELLWLVNIGLFATFTLAYLARWLLYPQEARRVFDHPVMSMYFGCIPMGLATIINGFLIFGIAHLGEGAVTIAYNLWWIDVAMSVGFGLAIPFLMFTRQSHVMEQMTSVWLLPVVASEVAAVSGGLLLSHIAEPSTQLSVLLASYVLWALSVPLAMCILVVLFLRMALHKLPPANMAASSWLALGPIGTGALGMFVLSANASDILAAQGLGAVASAISGTSLIAGIILWGYGLWWLAMAVMITIRYFRNGIPFNIGWWGYTFPLGVYAVATLRLSHTFPVASIGLFAGVLIGILAVVWLVVSLRTLRGVWLGQVFVDPSLETRTA
ncbi:TDT family transporter [Phyllobacterium myrsinacearum]|uniref:C4-dicarboxylate transporter/malic acid transport protein n=1 Tax=Phyllobacterium myrsinacearum TaxID=28101 RepID=A0A839EE84_9HYPH|nr:TDT family transporter [Phyllobacterium myrsinacearum]MBA8878393.1 C4-dicarboxylate transporter/malic acid transport protein [Phyllobacterium myrsinacearum]